MENKELVEEFNKAKNKAVGEIAYIFQEYMHGSSKFILNQCIQEAFQPVLTKIVNEKLK